MNDAPLRAEAAQRPIYPGAYATLPLSVEACLADVIAYEVDFYDNLYHLFRDLALRDDYSPNGLWAEIKRSYEPDLNFHNLKRFFVNQGLVPFDHELIEIIRRIDKDDDGTVSLRELDEFLLLIDSAYGYAKTIPQTIVEREIEREVERESIRRSIRREDLIRNSPPRRSLSRSYRSLRRSVYVPEDPVYYRSARRSIRRSLSRADSEERFSRSRDPLTKVRKNREDIKYSTYVKEQTPLPEVTTELRSMRESASSSYRKAAKLSRAAK